jgi:hypothetical protein
MSGTQLALKQSTGWFAAGRQFGQALSELSDAAFKLYAWLCLNADRRTGHLHSTVTVAFCGTEQARAVGGSSAPGTPRARRVPVGGDRCVGDTIDTGPTKSSRAVKNRRTT